MSVQTQAVDRAIAFLKAAGAQYKILLDGEEVGCNLPVVVARAKRTIVNDHVAATDYVNRLRTLQPEQLVTFERSEYPYLADASAWNSFCACVNGVAKKLFGEDKYILENVSGVRITVLRVE